MEAVEEGKYLSMFSSLMTELQGTLLLATQNKPFSSVIFSPEHINKDDINGQPLYPFHSPCPKCNAALLTDRSQN